MKYSKLAIDDPRKLIFGHAPYPVTARHGLTIGAGTVYPELNFTLAETSVNRANLPGIVDQYRSVSAAVLERSAALGLEGVVIEFETLLEMTLEPDIGVEITKVLSDACETAYTKYGLAAELRLTPNDTRDYETPPRMRTSPYIDTMMQLFEQGARAGGNLLSIESTGGKEIHDDAVLTCDVKAAAFALLVLGVRDMKFLWSRIVDIAAATGRIAGGDTACGFANTSMVLAEKNYIPRVFAAVDRVLSIVRTLVAYEQGAVGPDKDCGYEGPFIKAITGIPISMEGKTAACAHLSQVGNIPAAACDLWSNESVQNVMLLGAIAPVVSLEQLAYDARLMNAATIAGTAGVLQDLFVASDAPRDPQAFILAPENVIEISRAIVSADTHLEAGLRGAKKALELMENAVGSGRLAIGDREREWIPRIREELESIPTQEEQFVAMMEPLLEPGKTILSEYGL